MTSKTRKRLKEIDQLLAEAREIAKDYPQAKVYREMVCSLEQERADVAASIGKK